MINAATRNLKEGDADDKDFDRRLKIADRLLKEREVEVKRTNANDANGNEQPVQPGQRGIQGPGGAPEGVEGEVRRIGGQA